MSFLTVVADGKTVAHPMCDCAVIVDGTFYVVITDEGIIVDKYGDNDSVNELLSVAFNDLET